MPIFRKTVLTLSLQPTHLTTISPIGLAFLTSMFKTALSNNIIPHSWKLANIVHIPKTQQRHRQWPLVQAHIPPLSNCKDTGKEPYSLHNRKHIKLSHATRVRNSTVTALHTINNTVARGSTQMAPLARTISRYEQKLSAQ